VRPAVRSSSQRTRRACLAAQISSDANGNDIIANNNVSAR